jgi:hypothetical protein
MLQDVDTPVTIQAEAHSIFPYEKLQLVFNGETIAEAAPSGELHEARIELGYKIPRSGWFAVRTWGGPGSILYPGTPIFAHTSPIFLRVAGQPMQRSRPALSNLRGFVEQTQRWFESEARFIHQKWREHHLGQCAAALNLLKETETDVES